MVLRMENFNILGVHWKTRLLGGFTKNQYSQNQYNQNNQCFWGGVDTPNAHYESGATFEEKLIFCFKNEKNLVSFDMSTKKSKKFALWLVPFAQSIQRLT